MQLAYDDLNHFHSVFHVKFLHHVFASANIRSSLVVLLTAMYKVVFMKRIIAALVTAMLAVSLTACVSINLQAPSVDETASVPTNTPSITLAPTASPEPCSASPEPTKTLDEAMGIANDFLEELSSQLEPNLTFIAYHEYKRDNFVIRITPDENVSYLIQYLLSSDPSEAEYIDAYYAVVNYFGTLTELSAHVKSIITSHGYPECSVILLVDEPSFPDAAIFSVIDGEETTCQLPIP